MQSVTPREHDRCGASTSDSESSSGSSGSECESSSSYDDDLDSTDLSGSITDIEEAEAFALCFELPQLCSSPRHARHADAADLKTLEDGAENLQALAEKLQQQWQQQQEQNQEQEQQQEQEQKQEQGQGQQQEQQQGQQQQQQQNNKAARDIVLAFQVLCSAARVDRASLKRLESEVVQLQQLLQSAKAEREALLLRAQEAEVKAQDTMQTAKLMPHKPAIASCVLKITPEPTEKAQQELQQLRQTVLRLRQQLALQRQKLKASEAAAAAARADYHEITDKVSQLAVLALKPKSSGPRPQIRVPATAASVAAGASPAAAVAPGDGAAASSTAAAANGHSHPRTAAETAAKALRAAAVAVSGPDPAVAASALNTVSCWLSEALKAAAPAAVPPAAPAATVATAGVEQEQDCSDSNGAVAGVEPVYDVAHAHKDVATPATLQDVTQNAEDDAINVKSAVSGNASFVEPPDSIFSNGSGHSGRGLLSRLRLPLFKRTARPTVLVSPLLSPHMLLSSHGSTVPLSLEPSLEVDPCTAEILLQQPPAADLHVKQPTNKAEVSECAEDGECLTGSPADHDWLQHMQQQQKQMLQQEEQQQRQQQQQEEEQDKEEAEQQQEQLLMLCETEQSAQGMQQSPWAPWLQHAAEEEWVMGLFGADSNSSSAAKFAEHTADESAPLAAGVVGASSAAAVDVVPAHTIAVESAKPAPGRSSSSSSSRFPLPSPRRASRSNTPEVAAAGTRGDRVSCGITSAATGPSSSSSSSQVAPMPPLPLCRRSAHSPLLLSPRLDRTNSMLSSTGTNALSSGSNRRSTVHNTSVLVLNPDAGSLDVITSSPGAIMSSLGNNSSSPGTITSSPGVITSSYVIDPSAGSSGPKRAYGCASDNASSSSRRAHGAASRATAPLSTQYKVLESYGVLNLAEIMASPQATARALAHVRQVASCTGRV